ncbi:MAG: N-acetyltransferase [Actinomycetota bacterium]|uniref:GNAT family N-acetyltransferase n=1 Tax=Arthrobacter sp. A5 TaxID=576926 RepID=UPI0027F0A9D5|nr:N-acetyltransferase [Actinomycetota bacterium]
MTNTSSSGPAGEGGTGDAALSMGRQDNQDRYEARVGGELAATITYTARPESIDFVHTQTEEKFQGHGLATKLALFALDDAISKGKRIIPHCPFVADVVSTREDYEGRVDWPGTGA